MDNQKVLKKTFSKLGNEIVLVEVKPKIFSKTILIVGVIHGDEPQGKYLIEKFLQENVEVKNRLLFIPCLNPDGMKNNSRTNSNGVDINRNFSTKNWAVTEKNEFFGGENSSSEIETRFIEEVLEEFSPDAILTIHAPFVVVNYDGNARDIAEKISEIIEYPVQEDIGYPTLGSFGTYSGVERNIPTITLELDENMSVEDLYPKMYQIFSYLGGF